MIADLVALFVVRMERLLIVIFRLNDRNLDALQGSDKLLRWGQLGLCVVMALCLNGDDANKDWNKGQLFAERKLPTALCYFGCSPTRAVGEIRYVFQQ